MCYYLLMGVPAGAGDRLASVLPPDLTLGRLKTHSLGDLLPGGFEAHALLRDGCSCDLWHWPVGYTTTSEPSPEIHWRACLTRRGVPANRIPKGVTDRWSACKQWAYVRPDLLADLATLGPAWPVFYLFRCLGDDPASAAPVGRFLDRLLQEDLPDHPFMNAPLQVSYLPPLPAVAQPRQERAFLAALRDDPPDELTRAAFVDWLEEQGDPRVDVVRLMSAVAGGDWGSGELRGRVFEEVIPRWFRAWEPAGPYGIAVSPEGLLVRACASRSNDGWDRWTPALRRELGLEPSWFARVECTCGMWEEAAAMADSPALQELVCPLWVERSAYSSARLEDDAFPYLTTLPTLQVLATDAEEPHRDEGLALLGSAAYLESLCLDGHAAYTDAGIGHLSRLESLRHLSLHDPLRWGREPQASFTDDSLLQLLRAPRLESLSLYWRRGITLEGLARLCEPGGLRQVHVWECPPGVVARATQHPLQPPDVFVVSAEDPPGRFPGTSRRFLHG